jgi:general secretion pathway protein K
MGVDANDISVVSDSILDWIDADDLPRPAGAESDYYQGLNPPYYAKNAPMDDLSELLLVKEIRDHREIYWGGAATNHSGAKFYHKLGFGTAPDQTPDYPFGLKDVFTPFSTGKININTADKNVLAMILGGDTSLADVIISKRPFQNLDQLAAVTGLNPQQFGNLCDVSSSTYEVLVTAQIGDVKRVYVAILARTTRTDFQVVSFYWQ